MEEVKSTTITSELHNQSPTKKFFDSSINEKSSHDANNSFQISLEKKSQLKRREGMSGGPMSHNSVAGQSYGGNQSEFGGDAAATNYSGINDAVLLENHYEKFDKARRETTSPPKKEVISPDCMQNVFSFLKPQDLILIVSKLSSYHRRKLREYRQSSEP